MSLINSTIHDSLEALTAKQLAQLIVMRYGIEQFGYTYVSRDDDGQEIPVTLELLASMPGQDISELFDESEHDDAINEIKYAATQASGIPTWCHSSWDRHYDVSVEAFPMPDGRALAFCSVTGGGKHAEPNSYPWVAEAKFIMIDKVVERTISTYTFKEIPETVSD